MTSTIITKNSSTATSVPSSGSLTQGELAVNVTDKRLFTKDSGGTVVEVGTNPSSLTLPNGTANGIPYLNGSKVLTSGSALWFDGTNFGVGTGGNTLNHQSVVYKVGANAVYQQIANGSTGLGATNGIRVGLTSAGVGEWYSPTAAISYIDNSEAMRLTSTGLGIGTSSPSAKVEAQGNNVIYSLKYASDGGSALIAWKNSSGTTLWSMGGGINTSQDELAILRQGTMQAVFSSSGNLGLGVTPSAWSGFKAFDINTVGGISSDGGGTFITKNAYDSSGSGAWKYKTTASALLYLQQAGGAHAWYTAPSGTAGSAITFTQAMTLDASGALAIGSTSASASKLRVTVGGSAAGVRVDGITGSNQDFYALRNGASTIQDGPNITLQSASGTTYATSMQMGPTGETLFFNFNGSAWNERARIDSSGNLLVGTTTLGGAAGWGVSPNASVGAAAMYWNRSSTTSTSYVQDFRNAGSTVGYISYNNTSVTYSTSSDYRLKNTIAPMTGALAKVALLKPCTYKWNADGSDGEGFIAHELAEVCPHAVTGEKDAVNEDGTPKYQGIDTSFLVATLTAAIQELNAKFEAYKASHP